MRETGWPMTSIGDVEPCPASSWEGITSNTSTLPKRCIGSCETSRSVMEEWQNDNRTIDTAGSVERICTHETSMAMRLEKQAYDNHRCTTTRPTGGALVLATRTLGVTTTITKKSDSKTRLGVRMQRHWVTVEIKQTGVTRKLQRRILVKVDGQTVSKRT